MADIVVEEHDHFYGGNEVRVRLLVWIRYYLDMPTNLSLVEGESHRMKALRAKGKLCTLTPTFSSQSLRF